MTKPIWVGLDVHAKSISVAVLEDRSTTPTVTELPNNATAIRRFFGKLRADGEIHACYEAGPCGYEIYRQLESMGICCDVIAPSLIPTKAGDRIKTDRRDAIKLARLLRAGELTAVFVPSTEQEAARDLVRAREAARRARTAARNQLAKFLLRNGRHFSEGTNWTGKHWRWIRSQQFELPLQRVVFDDAVRHLQVLDARLADLDKMIHELAKTEPFKRLVDRLVCFRGVKTLGAMILLTELGDLRRFSSARALMAYVGLAIREHSSGERRSTGGITKAGNAHARRMLVEAAWSYRRGGGRLTVRGQRAIAGQPAEVVAISTRSHARLSRRYGRLVSRGKKPNVACVAVARELAGFVWAMAHVSEAA